MLAVDRNTPVGKRLGKFLARDADAERLGQVIYRLEGEEGNHYFKIDGSKGKNSFWGFVFFILSLKETCIFQTQSHQMPLTCSISLLWLWMEDVRYS